MECDVAELARSTALSVDTIRYYQSLGLLHPPERRGRRAVYDHSHFERLRRIRTMAERGFSLRSIGELLRGTERPDADRALLAAVEQEATGACYSSEALAERLGVPHALLVSVEQAGLAEGQIAEDGASRYSDGDLRVARGAIRLLRYGFPLTRLLSLAVKHNRAVRATVDEAIDLFDDTIRKRSGKEAEDTEAVARAFRELLPIVTALVAHHFQRALVNRALKRLKKSGEKRSLEAALRAASHMRFGLHWR